MTSDASLTNSVHLLTDRVSHGPGTHQSGYAADYKASEILPLSPSTDIKAYAPTLGIFTWVQGIKLRSLCLQGKLLTD